MQVDKKFAAWGLWLGLLAGSIGTHPAFASEAQASSSGPGVSVSAPGAPGSAAVHAARQAAFGDETASEDARQVANWVMRSDDNGGMPFVIVDKINAKTFVFDVKGRLLGAALVLLGLAKGDESVPGIGDRKLSSIRASERTTPAGRFVASLDHDLQGAEILWVDYEAAISLHRVIDVPKERRPQRLDSANALDRRISFGCINVPVKFYESVVSPAFTGTSGIVYVLPETRSLHSVFASYNVDENTKLKLPPANAGP